jgi:flagellar L-ring protein precursor FlgH
MAATRLLNVIILGLAYTGLIGCAGIEDKGSDAYAPIEPIVYPTVEESPPTGGLFAPKRKLTLFADVRAYEVGDIVSVVLVESTSAAKSADTELDKGSSVDIANPTIVGAPVEWSTNGNSYNLNMGLDSTSSFGGEASSSQNNSLLGAIAVQVSHVLPNGNLVIQGEKWIQINQGDEYIKLRGIIRPEDLSATNSIPSTLVADARISYGGTGPLEETNSPGWLTRFFMSPLMPF